MNEVNHTLNIDEQEELITEEEGLTRHLDGWQRWAIGIVAVGWSLFQLYIALPHQVYKILPWESLEAIYVKSIHLTFALALIFLGSPFFKKAILKLKFLSIKNKVPVHDWLFAIFAALAAFYVSIDRVAIAERLGSPIARDIIIGVLLIILLLEGCRRSIGPALSVMAILFTGYAFFAESMPDIISTRAVSLDRYIGQMTLSDEGIYGLPLHVSARTVFLFVLFGTMLERAGGGKFFTQIALSILGGFRGGPAKAAVVSSGLTGMVSGSSIANIVTTGTFTIPLMKKTGYPPKIAAAIEVAASTNGQLAPPIMGAAAFIIAEYVNVPYVEVIKAAAVPAFASYICLVYITHLEACKLGLKRIPRNDLPKFLPTLISGLHFLIPLIVLLWQLIVVRRTPETAAFLTCLMMIALILLKSVEEKLIINTGENHGSLIQQGWIELTTIFSLIGMLLAGQFGLIGVSVELASLITMLLMLWLIIGKYAYQSMTVDSFGDETKKVIEGIQIGIRDSLLGLESGARNMVAVALACAGAGIIVGVVNLGLGGQITEAVDHISQGNVMLLLFITAFASLVIGMGLPTTATYITMASLTALVIVELAGKHDIMIPLMAAHLFVFYFGILADDTPPVGLAAYAAAAIAKSKPIPTGVRGFLYDIRTAVLPFVFVLNPDIILHEINSWPLGILIFASTSIGCCAFAAATLGWFRAKNKWYEIILLLFTTFIFLRPDLFARWLNMDHSHRYWMVVPGLILFFGIYFWQSFRVRLSSLKEE